MNDKDIKNEELKELYDKITGLILEYNTKAKEAKSLTRMAYLFEDYNWKLDELEEGEELPEDWEPDWEDMCASPEAPGAYGWFPSQFC